MCTRPLTIRVPPNPYEYSQGFRGLKELQVPCGKCPECLGKRQKDISVRAYREALKYNKCDFVTLTYAPDSVPFAQTLLSLDNQSGEVLIDKVSEVVTNFDMLSVLRSEYHTAQSGVFYKYKSIATLEDTEYQVVYTPTLYYEDVKLVIKNFRVKYMREFNEKLDFTYICVGEYGKKKSIRPHYHILFFGLTDFQVMYFCTMWKKGKYYVEPVKFKNEDGSDGLAKVAGYIGKYASKGTFNPSSVLNHFTIPCRVASSRGLGMDNLDRLVGYYRGYDLVGKYDIEKCDFDYDKTKFYELLFNRMKYDFAGKSISLPLSLRRKIFDYRIVDSRACWSRLYYEIMDYARVRYQDNCDREFRQFIDGYPDSEIPKMVVVFNRLQESNLLDREKGQRERLAKFYSKSKF